MTIKEGDRVIHNLDRTRELEVIRVDATPWGDPVLIVRDASGEYPPGHSFKVDSWQVRKVYDPQRGLT